METNLGLSRAWVTPRGTPRPLPGWTCATTLAKGVCVTELYPLIPPALPKYYTPLYNCLTASGHRLLQIGFRSAGDQQQTRPALLELT